MHGTILAFGIIQCFNSSIYKKGKITNIGSKRDAKVGKKICSIYIKVNLQKILLLQTEVNSKPLYKHKKGFAGHEVQVKPKPKV